MFFTIYAALGAAVAGQVSASVLGRDFAAAHRVERDFGDKLMHRDFHEGSNVRRQAAKTCLNANAVQTGSASTGQVAGAVADGQVNSATDPANFINFCSGSTLTNGLQVKTGSCNGVVMGKIPSTNNMVSSMLISPTPGQVLPAGQTFTISVQMQGLAAGAFSNAQQTYYSAPQNLDGSGKIIGHTHVTVQDMGNSFTPKKALDPTAFAFFKGINDAGNGNGLLSATVTGGLPAGFYRVCTMSSSTNHQPVLMPVAQRGAQDDCTKFQVTAGGGGNNNNNNNNAGQNNQNPAPPATPPANNNNNNNNNQKPPAAAPSVAPPANNNNNNNGGGQNNQTPAAPAGAVKINSGTLGGAPPAVTASGNKDRPFSVNGNTFTDAATAVARACDIQFNACANAVNGGKLPGSTLANCTTQQKSCRQA